MFQKGRKVSRCARAAAAPPLYWLWFLVTQYLAWSGQLTKIFEFESHFAQHIKSLFKCPKFILLRDLQLHFRGQKFC